MEKTIERFFDTISESELESFEIELENIKRSCPAGDADDILARTLDKAGFRPKPAKKKKRRLFILIAAAIMISATVGFAANFNKLDVYFGIRNSESPFVGIFGERGAKVSDDDLTLSVDGAFSDEMFSHFLISLTAQTREGRKTIDKLERVYHLTKGYASDTQDEEFAEEVYGHIDTEKLYNEGKQFHTGFIYDQGTGNKNYAVWDTHYYGYNTASAFYFEVMLDKSDPNLDPTRPITITEAISGLTVTADLTPNLKTVKLVSDDPNAYRNVTLSSLGVHIVSPDDDPFIANKVITDNTVISDDAPVMISIRKKDGSVVDAPNAFAITHWGDVVKAGNVSYPDTPTKVDSYARLSELTMLEDIDRVTILGIDYRLEG